MNMNEIDWQMVGQLLFLVPVFCVLIGTFMFVLVGCVLAAFDHSKEYGMIAVAIVVWGATSILLMAFGS